MKVPTELAKELLLHFITSLDLVDLEILTLWSLSINNPSARNILIFSVFIKALSRAFSGHVIIFLVISTVGNIGDLDVTSLTTNPIKLILGYHNFITTILLNKITK